jgi:hypothetical protein
VSDADTHGEPSRLRRALRGHVMGAALRGARSVHVVVADIRNRSYLKGMKVDAKEELVLRSVYSDLVSEGLICADGSVERTVR